MRTILTFGLLFVVYLAAATNSFAETLVYPNPAPDSRIMTTYWREPNICHQDSIYPITTNSNGDYVYRTSASCTSGNITEDSTAPLSSTKTSSVGQVIKIPAGINRITRIYFDSVWVGNDVLPPNGVKGTQVGMNSEIRIYQGTDRTTLLASKTANVPWSGAAAGNTSASFDNLSVTPGTYIYVELYSTDNLDNRDGGDVVRVPINKKVVDDNNGHGNGNLDAYADGYSVWDSGTRYAFTTHADSDLAYVKVYGVNLPNPPTCTLSGPTNVMAGVSVNYSALASGTNLTNIYGYKSPAAIPTPTWTAVFNPNPTTCSGSSCSGSGSTSFTTGQYKIACNVEQNNSGVKQECTGSPWATTNSTGDAPAWANCGAGGTLTVNVREVNCSNLSGPTSITLGSSGNYAANVISNGTTVSGSIQAYNSAGSLVYDPTVTDFQTASGNIATSWTPTASGTYTVICRGINPNVKECKGNSAYLSTGQYVCPGPTTSQTVTVVKPNCNSGISCTEEITCTTSTANSCSTNNGTKTGCTYTTHTSGVTCNSASAPNQSCTVNNCNSGYSCVSGTCTAPTLGTLNVIPDSATSADAVGSYGISGLRSNEGGGNAYNAIKITQNVSNASASVKLVGTAFTTLSTPATPANLSDLKSKTGTNGFIILYASENVTLSAGPAAGTGAGQSGCATYNFCSGRYYVYFGGNWYLSSSTLFIIYADPCGTAPCDQQPIIGVNVHTDSAPPSTPVFSVTFYKGIGNQNWTTYGYLNDVANLETVAAKPACNLSSPTPTCTQ